LEGQQIPIYGAGKNIRDWLYVADHCSALDAILHKGILGESYNVGTNNEKTNNDLVILICKILDEEKPLADRRSYSNQISYVEDRLGHDYRYAIDNSKICLQLKWTSSFPFIDSLRDTVKWYMLMFDDIKIKS